MTCAYQYGGSLYLNITNRCPCACVFCIRIDHEGVGDGGSLWLEEEPTAADVIRQMEAMNLEEYREIVFCGYGEPFEKLDIMLDICRYIKQNHAELPVRINTNGLGDLIHGFETAPLLERLVDKVSISLNAPDAARYVEITNPSFGEDSFDAMLRFAENCKRYVPDVRFSVVDVISPEEIARCETLAGEMEIPLRVRTKA